MMSYLFCVVWGSHYNTISYRHHSGVDTDAPLQTADKHDGLN